MLIAVGWAGLLYGQTILCYVTVKSNLEAPSPFPNSIYNYFRNEGPTIFL